MKYVNWRTIATSLASLLIIGLLTSGYYKATAEIVEYQALKVEVAQQTQQMKQMKEQTVILREMAADVAGIKKSILTVTGKATVRDFGADACLRINTSGRASAYATMDRARITNMSSAEMPSVVVKVEGTFLRADEDFLAIISKHAGSLIDAKANTTLNIRIEPVEEVK